MIVPAVYIIFSKDSKILLHRRANTGYMDGKYSLPSGHLDGGESAVEAAIRETKEEIGVDINPKDLRFIHLTHRVAEEGDHERMDLYFAISKWQGRSNNAEPDKCDDIRWFEKDNLPENIIPAVKTALELIAHGELYSEHNF